MNAPNNEGLKDNSKDDQKEVTKSSTAQKPQQYPNNLKVLREAKHLQRYMIMSRMNTLLQKNLVVDNYDGWEKGEHLPNLDQRDALVKILGVESEIDIWPTLIHILEEQREKRRNAALRKNPSQNPQTLSQPNPPLEPITPTPQPEPNIILPDPLAPGALSPPPIVEGEDTQLPASVHIPVTPGHISSSTLAIQTSDRYAHRQLFIKIGAGLALFILFSSIGLLIFWHSIMAVPISLSTPPADTTPSILPTRVHEVVLNKDQPVLCIECQYSGLIVLIKRVEVDGDHDTATVTLQFTNKTATSFGVQFITLSLTDKNGNSYHLVYGTANPFGIEAHTLMIIKPVFEFISTSSNTYTLDIVVTDNDNLWRNTYQSHPTVPTLPSSTV